MSRTFPRGGARRALQGAAAGVVALGLLLWWLLPLGEEPPSGSITFSTGTPRGVYQKYGTLLRTELSKDMPNLEVRLLTSDGSQENVARVATGEADFTIAAADAVETYELNKGPGADRLRGVARLYDDYVHLVVARDSGIDSVTDLRGRRVAIGRPHSGVRLIATRVLKAAGIDARQDITPLSDGIDTGPDRLARGRSRRSSGRAGCRRTVCGSWPGRSRSGSCRSTPASSTSCTARARPPTTTARPACPSRRTGPAAAPRCPRWRCPTC
ncbi:hypothetical protein GCM10020295_21340 [Streptomyces cinereospinus]